jgi:hypothetical protein
MKRLWLVRLGKNGEFEADAFERSLLSIGFNMSIDLTNANRAIQFCCSGQGVSGGGGT